MMESGQSGFGVQSPKSPQQPMAPRNLPYPQQQPPMGQPQGGAQGGNAPRGIPGGENNFQRFGGSPGGGGQSNSMRPPMPQGPQQPNPIGRNDNFGFGQGDSFGQIGGVARPQIDPMAFQKLMEMLKQGPQSPFGNDGSMPSAPGGGIMGGLASQGKFTGGGVGNTGKSLY